MPWVLRDYSSPRLDLADPASYRDLARPIGAQTEERRRLFRSRYAGWADADGVPPFHYGSHYSSAAYVLWCARRRSIDGVRFGEALPLSGCGLSLARRFCRAAAARGSHARRCAV